MNTALSGFRPSNPVERLDPYVDLIDAECLDTIASLRGRLQDHGLIERLP
jgi:hypothetical protein